MSSFEQNLLHSLKPNEVTTFQQLYNQQQKSVRVAMALALVLGGLGAHKFYQGRLLTGMGYLLDLFHNLII